MAIERPRRSPEEQAEADRVERRQFWIIAAVFAVAMVAMTGLYVVISNAVRPSDPGASAAEQIQRPALPIPDGGEEPIDSGDRGGSQQLLLMAGLVVVFAGGTAWVIHSSRKARRRRAEALAPAAADDAVDAGASDTEPSGSVSASAGSPEPR